MGSRIVGPWPARLPHSSFGGGSPHEVGCGESGASPLMYSGLAPVPAGLLGWFQACEEVMSGLKGLPLRVLLATTSTIQLVPT